LLSGKLPPDQLNAHHDRGNCPADYCPGKASLEVAGASAD
jgi:hypothetical protein